MPPSDAITLRPPEPFSLTLSPPGSKSISNRALLFAALAAGSSTLRGLLDADDTRHMRACLTTLGLSAQEDPEAPTTLRITGQGGRLRSPAGQCPTLYVGTAGTVARLLGAALAGSPVHVVLDGTPRMRERPMAQLLDALSEQGARLIPQGAPGFLPVEIGPDTPRLRGGTVRLSRPASSQIVSGLVVSATLAASPTRIVLEQGTPARPYVDMTLAVLEAFGGSARWEAADTLYVEPGTLRGIEYVIEPDASAASYPLGLAALYGSRCRIPALGRASLQGDVGFAPRVLARMGADVEQTNTETIVQGRGRLRGGNFDLTDMPDMTLTLAVLALHAEGPTRIDGVGILRHHESDRLAAISTELRKLGATVKENPDGLSIDPPAGGPRRGIEVDTYEDHRMAMALSLVGDVVVRDPGCVAKTWPNYFSVLRKLGMVARSAQ